MYRIVSTILTWNFKKLKIRKKQVIIFQLFWLSWGITSIKKYSFASKISLQYVILLCFVPFTRIVCFLRFIYFYPQEQYQFCYQAALEYLGSFEQYSDWDRPDVFTYAEHAVWRNMFTASVVMSYRTRDRTRVSSQSAAAAYKFNIIIIIILVGWYRHGSISHITSVCRCRQNLVW